MRVIVPPALVLLLAACQGGHSDSGPSSRLQETRSFWETLAKLAADAADVHAFPSNSTEAAVAMLDYSAQAERERVRTIVELPVLHVHPDLAAYAARFVKARTDVANLFDECLMLAGKQEEIMSAPSLGFGFFMNALNRRDEPEDGFVWRALLDSAHQTGEELQALYQPAKALEAKAISVRNALSELTADELAVRAKLTQRFGVEFPPAITYATAVVPQPRPLTAEEIEQSLIGRRRDIARLIPAVFDEVEEVSGVTIENITHQSRTLADYDVNARVKTRSTFRLGLSFDSDHKVRNLKLRLTYGRLESGWKLIEVRQLP